MKNKKLLLLITLLMAATAFSCSEKDKKAEQDDLAENVSSETTIKEDDYYLSDLSNERYDGYNYRILIRKGQINDQYLENDSEDIVESATYKRNKAVEERYGITISAVESSHSNAETDALNSILAGDDAYDVIFPHTGSAFQYAISGAVYNINDIESIHQDKPWWSQDVTDSYDINGNLYMIDGDITVHRLKNAVCLFFNKKIFDELGFEYPYELVLDGEWTFDEFSYLVKKGGSDLNGDGIITPEYDRFGFFAQEFNSPIGILYSGGQKIYDKSDSGELELTLYSNKTVDIFDEYFSLMDNAACFLNTSQSGYKGNNPFIEGRAMFIDGTLGNAVGYRSMEDDFGILPLPKFDEDDEYASIVNGFAHMVVIPITVSDVERTGAITEALCAYGSRDVIPAFYEVSLKTKAARDDESEQMIDILKDSIVYDVGYASGGPFTFCGYSLANSASHDFASFYAANESAARNTLEKFNENYGR